MRWEEILVGGWSIGHPACYVGSALALSTLVRVILSVVRALKPARAEYSGRYLFSRGGLRFIGVFICSSAKEFWPHRTFDLDPFIVGTLELAGYPVLMKLQAWPVIGAWLGFKTVAQWDAWRTGRSEYNQFLIGNALVLCLSLLLTRDVWLRVQP